MILFVCALIGMKTIKDRIIFILQYMSIHLQFGLFVCLSHKKMWNVMKRESVFFFSVMIGKSDFYNGNKLITLKGN